jgi:Zn-dependent M28 family amino/carboxypeptidase
MVSRNATNLVYVVGSDALSSEFDRAVKAMNERFVHVKLDYTYTSPTHPQRFFMRSDHYPFIRYGIPSLCFSGGDHPDYHQEGDTPDKADFKKMENIARLAYVLAWDAANRNGLYKLDANPEITRRGAQNMKYNWLRLSPPKK